MKLREAIKKYLREQCFTNPTPPPTYGNYGCMDATALNFDLAATHPCSAGSPSFTCANCNSQPDYCGPGNYPGDCCTYPQPILGCTDSNANNYNPNATIDNGSCTYNEFHLFTDCGPILSNMGSQGVTWNGLPGYDPAGSTNPTIAATNSLLFYTFLGSPNIGQLVKIELVNFNGNILTLCLEYDGSTNQNTIVGSINSPITVISTHGDCNDCMAVYGCTDSTAINYNANATINDPNNPCVYAIPGCTDPLALNYDPLATVDDGSCLYDLEPCCEWCQNPTPGNPPTGCYDWMCNNVDYCPPDIISDNPCDELENYVLITYPNWQGTGPLDVTHFCEKCKFGGLQDSMCKCCKKGPCDKIPFIDEVNMNYGIEIMEFCKHCSNNSTLVRSLTTNTNDPLCKCCKRFEKIKPINLGEEIKVIKKLL